MSVRLPPYVTTHKTIEDLNQSLRYRDGIFYQLFKTYTNEHPLRLKYPYHNMTRRGKGKDVNQVEFTFDFVTGKITSSLFDLRFTENGYRLSLKGIDYELPKQFLLSEPMREIDDVGIQYLLVQLIDVYHSIDNYMKQLSVIHQVYLENVEDTCTSVSSVFEYFGIQTPDLNLKTIDSDALDILELSNTILKKITALTNSLKGVVYENVQIKFPHDELSISPANSRYYSAKDGYSNYIHVSSMHGVGTNALIEFFIDEAKNELVLAGSCFNDIRVNKVENLKWAIMTAASTSVDNFAPELVYPLLNRACGKLNELLYEFDGLKWLCIEFQYRYFIYALSKVIEDER